MYVPDSPYGHRKAKRHGQAEANRTGRRTYMQLERTSAGPLYVITTQGYLSLPNAPFYTFYPEVPQS